MLSSMGSQTLVPPDDSRYKVTEPITSNFLSADSVGKLLASTLPETGWNGLKLPKSESRHFCDFRTKEMSVNRQPSLNVLYRSFFLGLCENHKNAHFRIFGP